MTTGHKSELLPLVGVLGAVLLWGSSFATMKFAVGHFPPVIVVGVRMIIAFVLILPLLPRLPRPRYQPGDWKFLVLMALLEPCLYFFLEAYALVYTTSSQAGMIAALVPLLVIVGARLFMAEQASAFAQVGIVISIIGVIMLTVSGDPQHGAVNPMLGNVLEFAAMCCAAGFILMLKYLSVRYHALHLTAIQFFLGSLFFLPGFFLFPVEIQTALALKPLISILYLGTFVTFGAFALYNYAVSKMSVGRVSAFINLIPVVALLLGWGVMNEQINAMQWGAVVLVMTGVLISQKNSPVEVVEVLVDDEGAFNK
jgi:drug/metabolite transporter (DMT)-like permease